jgi:hypothetical protein
MSGEINPEAGQPTTVQSFVQSDQNPVVTCWGGTDADGGQVQVPAASESRMTPPSPATAADAGLANYDSADVTD